jgi:hypothetical protein
MTPPANRLFAILTALPLLAGCATAPRSASDTTEGISPSTIRHTVLIDLKDAADSRTLIEEMDARLAPIPGVDHYWRGTPFRSDRPEVLTNYDVALIIDFRDARAYDAYSNDPRHVSLVREWKPRINSLTIYDTRPNAEPR